jgi:hypothetical protein
MKNTVIWDVKPYVSYKMEEHGFLQEPHSVTSQKTTFFILLIQPKYLPGF